MVGCLLLPVLQRPAEGLAASLVIFVEGSRSCELIPLVLLGDAPLPPSSRAGTLASPLSGGLVQPLLVIPESANRQDLVGADSEGLRDLMMKMGSLKPRQGSMISQSVFALVYESSC